jgi:CRP-like cAMP-binding protein
VALRPLRCLVLSGEELPLFLTAKPSVMLRMLQAEARRLRSNIQWRN